MAEANPPESNPPDVFEEKWGMDISVNAMLFAEELIDYVLTKLGYEWPCRTGARSLPVGFASKRFTPVIGETVIELMANNMEHIANSYKGLLAMGIREVDDFRREVCITATMYFPKGYDPENLLTFSALLAGVSAFYFTTGNTRIADASAQVLSYIINYFIYQCVFRPSADWFNLCLVAQGIRRSLKEEGVEFIVPCSPKKTSEQ